MGLSFAAQAHTPVRWYFNPRAPCGARPPPPRARPAACIFQSTRPLRGATGGRLFHHCGWSHFNPRAPCGARPATLFVARKGGNISIHAPLAGRDPGELQVSESALISIHAPLAGRDFFFGFRILPAPLFQSTRPLRGATISFVGSCVSTSISIHAPLAGRDKRVADAATSTDVFQSTRPLRGATKMTEKEFLERYFNPRAPCGARRQGTDNGARRSNFNPRAPCGARPWDDD